MGQPLRGEVWYTSFKTCYSALRSLIPTMQVLSCYKECVERASGLCAVGCNAEEPRMAQEQQRRME